MWLLVYKHGRKGGGIRQPGTHDTGLASTVRCYHGYMYNVSMITITLEIHYSENLSTKPIVQWVQRLTRSRLLVTVSVGVRVSEIAHKKL